MATFSKSNVPQFSVEVYQNEYLPEGGREVNAIVTVTATGGGTTGGTIGGATAGGMVSSASIGTGAGAGGGTEWGDPTATGRTDRGPDAAVVIMVDCSGSMDYPPTKMRGARDATAAAVGTVRDGVAFAVVAGTHQAKEVYPGGGRLAVASEATRAQAKDALRKLSAGGGTAIGTWLRLADRLLGSADVAIRHGILLTDGRNEHESPEDLRHSLEACAGRFTCDARGVGTDWEVKEVTAIASALLGSADIVADPAGLTADFTRMMESAMGKEVGDVTLRLWTPQGAEVVFVKQVAPTVEELTGRRMESGPRSGDYPTGSWGDESRDYHVCVRVPDAGVGREMLAARVSLVLPETAGTSAPRPLSQGLVRAVWTDDLAASTSINPQVAHYTGQAELARVIQQGLHLRKAGDIDGATAKLGRAVQLAGVSGNEGTAKLLAKVVDVVDAATGTVRLKAKVTEEAEMTLETRSTKTVRVKK
ncbi:VWA domain-containing protein [Streptomyces varsoviensis]|uniref:vWA domain-containing protein n=1 Tax=Streptomyces varsoviensis TaxID=67373 RepID=UPI00340FE71A